LTVDKLSALLPPERTGREAPAELLAIREAMAGAAAAGQWANDPPLEEVEIGGARCLLARSPEAERATIIHFHGGGYRIGMPEAVGPFAVELAQRCRVSVLCPEYRLAPDHPFPAALHDAAAVIEAVAGQAGMLFLSGDSAGGGIAASLACLCRQADIDLSGLVLISPWLDLRVTAASHRSNAQSDPIFSEAAAQAAAGQYLQEYDAADPLASPVLADVSGCPPVCMSAGSGEVLVDDARSFQGRLSDAGVEVRLSVIADMEHVAVTRGQELTGSRQVLSEIADFVDELIHRANARA